MDVTAQLLPSSPSIGAAIGLSNIDLSTITGGVSDAMNYIASGFEPRGLRNHNPGNLRYIPDPVQFQRDPDISRRRCAKFYRSKRLPFPSIGLSSGVSALGPLEWRMDPGRVAVGS